MITVGYIDPNETICKFMDFGNIGTKEPIYAIIFNGKAKGYFKSEDMLFHEDWNWLMPVVKSLFFKHLINVNLIGYLITGDIINTFNEVITIINGLDRIQDK